MRRLLLPLLLFAYSLANAQDYTNRGLMQIKELTESAIMNWNKSFDEGVQNNDLSKLVQQRQKLELYLDQQLANMKQLMAQGDERGLLTTIANYLQIEKQYVKNVMVSAEKIKTTDVDAVAHVNQQMTDFTQKEKYFLMEINNALATSGNDDIPPPPPVQANDKQVDDEDPAENAKNKSAVLGDEPEAKKHKKLPHEIMEEEETDEPQPAKKTKGKHKVKQQKEEEEE